MVQSARQSSPDHPSAGLRRLGKKRLVREAEERLKAPSEDEEAWKKRPIDELAGVLAEKLDADTAETLAAEGMSRQKAPSVGGPSWVYTGDRPLDARLAEDAGKLLPKRCPNDWENIEVSQEPPDMFGGVTTLEYTSWDVKPTGKGLVWVPTRSIALILFDYEDGVITVSAGSDSEAHVIAASLEKATGGKLTPISLELVPSVSAEKLSGKTLQMLEGVYGRMGEAVTIVNVDKVKTKRQDPTSPVQWQTAKGLDDHVLVDDDVRNCLLRGDDLIGVAMQIDWNYVKDTQEKHFPSHVTLTSSDEPFVLRVTRGGKDVKIASSLYVLLRRALLQPTAQKGKERVRAVIEGEVLKKSKKIKK